MFRFILAALAVFFVTSAHAAEVDCNVHGLGYLKQGARMEYNFAKLLLTPGSDAKTLLTYSSQPPTAMADIIDLWRAMGCASQAGDMTAIGLRNRWASGIGETIDGFNASKLYKHYVAVARVPKTVPHLKDNLLSQADRQLIADTTAWGKATGNPRFALTLEGLTKALNLPPPQR